MSSSKKKKKKLGKADILYMIDDCAVILGFQLTTCQSSAQCLNHSITTALDNPRQVSPEVNR